MLFSEKLQIFAFCQKPLTLLPRLLNHLPGQDIPWISSESGIVFYSAFHVSQGVLMLGPVCVAGQDTEIRVDYIRAHYLLEHFDLCKRMF